MLPIFGILIYACCEGITEGLAFSEHMYFGTLHYHIWRLGELLGIWLAIAPFLGWFTTFGWLLIGMTLYERLLQAAQRDGFWTVATEYDLGFVVLPWGWAAEIGRLLVGIGLVLCSIP